MPTVLLLRAPQLRAAASALGSRSTRHATMPLRAKILNPAFLVSNQAQMASTVAATIPTELPTDDPDDVLFNSLYGLRTIELNRPKKLNSLNGSMARKIAPRLREWQKSDLANVIVIKGRSDRPASSNDATPKRLLPKAFCAGGDVAAVVKHLLDENNPKGKDQAKSFFALEYQLDHLIATYTKPYIAFMDGITMGGGAGLSVHAPFRIATERTVFAMPETGIGFFPDVGASFFLNRLVDGKVGMYLAMTGESLKGVDVFYAGLATHYIHSSSLPDLESRLAELRFNDYDNLEERCKIIDSTIEEFHTGLPHDRPLHSSSSYNSSFPSSPQILSGDLRTTLDRIFSYTSLTKIISALESESWSNHEDNNSSSSSSSPSTGIDISNNSQQPENAAAISQWARQTLETLNSRSPTSVRVALRQMILGKKWSLSETFQREFLIATRFLEHPDFKEGVGRKLLDKPPSLPTWSSIPEDVEQEKEYINGFFRLGGTNDNNNRGRIKEQPGQGSGAGEGRLELWNPTDYNEPRFIEWIGLPTETQVREFIENPPREVFTMRSKLRRAKKEMLKNGMFTPRIVEDELSSAVVEEGGESMADGVEDVDGEDYANSKKNLMNRERRRERKERKDLEGGASGMEKGMEDVKNILTKEKIVEFFVRQRNGKIGVREKVEEILERKTRSGGGGADGASEEGEVEGEGERKGRGQLEWID
ncbi:MAG: hypothetical protein M1823_005728 [Watsoniomyces obsoletus]|nr:MAG: hypothetical protein M1823_005728 [Watsoniomyces obsoletus]